MDPCWYHGCGYDVIFKLVLELWSHKYHYHRDTTFLLKLENLVCYFCIIHIRPNLRSNFCNHRRLKRFQKNLCISKLFGSRGGGIEILTMIGVQKRLFLAKSENWANVYACSLCKFIVNDKCLVYTCIQFGLSSKYSYYKNWTTPYFIVRGPTSFLREWENTIISTATAVYWALI